MITTALLLLACPTAQAHDALPTSEPVFVELTRGRGTLLAGESTVTLRGVEGEQWVEGRGHLSLVANAKATLRWHGRASIQLDGPCEVEWKPCDANAELMWSFQRVSTAMVESRRAPLSIELGADWSVSMPPGAFTLRGLAGGSYEVFQQAGTPANYQWNGSQLQTRPTRTGVIGRPIRLGATPGASRLDNSAKLDGRPNWTWPWREEAQDVKSWGYRDWPWVAGPPTPVTVHVKRNYVPAPAATPPADVVVTVQPMPVVTEPTPPAPEPTPPAPEPTPPAPEPTPQAPEPMPLVTEPAPIVEPAPAPPVVEDSASENEEAPEPPPVAPEANTDGDGMWGWDSDESKTADPWRGEEEDGYIRIGDYHIQNRTGILYEELADGGIRFWIPESYKARGWILGPRLDTRLSPGGSIEFSPSGALRQHSGGVRVLAALKR